jgi:hypothetical protein
VFTRFQAFVAALGLSAALVAHETLRAIAALHWGAASFAEHEHTALAPTLCVEIVLAVWLVAVAVGDALRGRGTICYRRASFAAPRWVDSVPPSVAIAAIAALGLFGMEYSESGTAALGFGWIGGSLTPGALVLAAAIGAAISLMRFALAGRMAAFERLIALFAAALDRFIVQDRALPRPASRRFSTRVIAPEAPCSRHAGLRAPPAVAI